MPSIASEIARVRALAMRNGYSLQKVARRSGPMAGTFTLRTFGQDGFHVAISGMNLDQAEHFARTITTEEAAGLAHKRRSPAGIEQEMSELAALRARLYGASRPNRESEETR